MRSSQPVLACLGSQYAGWNLSSEGYFAMGSGPGPRAGPRRAAVFDALLPRHGVERRAACWRRPSRRPPAVVEKVAKATGLAAENLTFIYAPTQSLAGAVQIVARVLEVALHKANDLKFPLDNIVDGIGTAPIPAPHPDFLTAMGRTNDAIIYGGTRAALRARAAPTTRATWPQKLPSRASRDYGDPFAEIFKHFKGDFYAIDPLLFSPAEVIVTAIETGDTFRAGAATWRCWNRALARTDPLPRRMPDIMSNAP